MAEDVDLGIVPPPRSTDATITDPIEIVNGEVDSGNSSSTPLGISGTFTGSAKVISNISSIMVNVYSDVASDTDGLKIEQSTNGVNWDHDDVFTIPSGSGKNFTINPHAQYLRVRYVNGTSAQSAFRLQVILKTAEATPSSHRIKDPIVDDDDARLVKSVPMTQGASSTEYNVVGPFNPLHTRNVDSSRRVGLNTVFGDAISGQRVPSLAAQFQYGIEDGNATSATANGGTVAFSESRLVISTSTNTAGSAEIESVDTLRYVPGNEAYALFTASFVNGGSDADNTMYAGLFDFDGGNGNGFYVGFNGTDFVCGRRRDGTDYQEVIDVSTVFPDGSFDPTLGNIYRISYGYLGYAPIHFEIMSVYGDWLNLCEIQYPNSSIDTHIINTYLPLRGEVTNTGSSLNHQIYIGSVQAGIVDGSATDVSSRNFTYALSGVTTGTPTYNVLALSNKSTFASITNRVPVQLTLLSAATDGNKSVSWSIYKNPTLTAPSWTDVDTNNSVMQYLANPTSSANGTLEIPWSMAKVDSFFEDIERYSVTIRPGESVLIKANTASASIINFGIRWKELF